MSGYLDRDGADMAKRFVEQLIVENWRDIYVGTRRIERFGKVARFPITALRGMDMCFSVDYITVNYGGETYTIAFDIDRKVGKPKDFLFSSNWNAKPELLLAVHKTYLQHLSGLLKIGAA